MIEKPALQLLEPALSEAERVFGGGKPAVLIFSPMRYLLKARVKPGKKPALIDAIDQQTLGRASIAGDEYLHNMQQARVDDAGVPRLGLRLVSVIRRWRKNAHTGKNTSIC